MEHKLKSYIEKVEDEIEELIGGEDKNAELNFDSEKSLHILFENRKHAKQWLCELHGAVTAGTKA